VAKSTAGGKEHFRIKRFAILYKLLDVDDGELTKTGKIRRKFVREKYRTSTKPSTMKASAKRRSRPFPVPGRPDHHGENQIAVLHHGRVLMTYFFQLVVSGIVVGSIYALSALGFVLIYKSSRVLNIAHGQIIAGGAFITYALTVFMGGPIVLPFF
jgi:hypothetical protein